MHQTRARRLHTAVISLLLFILVAVLYLAIQVERLPTDTAWTVPTSLSLLHERNLDLNEYPYAAGDPNGVLDLHGRLISFFPLATPILITPAVGVADMLLRPSLDLYTHLRQGPDWLLIARLNLTLASLVTAGTVVMMHRALRRLHNESVSLAVALVFAFGTMMWSTASRDLWQHTLSAFMLALTLYLLIAARTNDLLIQFVGLSVALAYTIRPTNSIAVIVITLYILLRHRCWLPHYLSWAAAVALPFFLLNVRIYGSILPPYFLSNRLTIHQAFLEALIGNLISPARGLLVYAPVLLFAIYGSAYQLRTRALSALDWTLAAIILAHWVAISSFWHWWGGASYGPRFFTDMLPFLAYFLSFGVAAILAQPHMKKMALGTAFTLLAVLSVAIHARSVADERVWAWNGENRNVVPSVDAAPMRVWDWRDPPFARGLRRPEMRLDADELQFHAPAGMAVSFPLTVTVRNLGDRPLMWDVDLPRRVVRLPAEPQLHGLSFVEVSLTADVAGLAPGCHPLGAALFRATPTDARGAPAVVPMTVTVDGQNAGGGETCSAAAADLLIQDRSQDGAGGVRALFGSGWYDLEGTPPDTWRWASSPAQVLVYSRDATSLRLESAALALYDPDHAAGEERGALRISIGEETGRVAIEIGRPFSYTLGLRPGWNDLRLELEAGNFRPVDRDPATGDTRTLSFALDTIHLTH